MDVHIDPHSLNPRITIVSPGLFWWAYFREGLITGGKFPLQKWICLYLEVILRPKMLRQKEFGYRVEKLNFLANASICMLPRNTSTV